MSIMEHAGGDVRPGAAPEMQSRLTVPRLSQRAGGKDYVSSKQTPSNEDELKVLKQTMTKVDLVFLLALKISIEKLSAHCTPRRARHGPAWRGLTWQIEVRVLADRSERSG